MTNRRFIFDSFGSCGLPSAKLICQQSATLPCFVSIKKLVFFFNGKRFLPARTGDRHGYAENTARIVEKQHCTLTLASKLMNIRN